MVIEVDSVNDWENMKTIQQQVNLDLGRREAMVCTLIHINRSIDSIEFVRKVVLRLVSFLEVVGRKAYDEIDCDICIKVVEVTNTHALKVSKKAIWFEIINILLRYGQIEHLVVWKVGGPCPF
jgi:hypothetical protein